ncbi:NUDIX hydrolase [Rugosimonospora africana]|uniref:NUDIX hydrolase n=1 Tax=Rugosimonospora africana TaxID=556532 RepID=UPI001EF2DDDA|nr:NUDIX domain-containing protein [Rugosimonospora africana]
MAADAAPRTPLVEALAGYRARGSAEIADLERFSPLLSVADPWHRSTPLHVTCSALIVHPPTRRVLLRWHARQQAWLQVGGHADPGETDPLAITLREGLEETGIADLRPWPDASLVHLAVVSVTASAKEPAHEHADLRYVLATDAPETARPENPAAELRWLSMPEAEALVAEPNLRETLSRVGRLFDELGPR